MAVAGDPGADPPPFTEILMAAIRGDDEAAEAVVPRVYRELRSIARSALGRERQDHTLQATALVHECWIRLVGDGDAGFAGRAHFFGSAAEAMRRILVEHARRRARMKRGGGAQQVPLSSAEPSVTEDPLRFLALDEAISRLKESGLLAAEVVRLRFYAGLTVDETAEALGLSRRTLMREWAYARARLFRELADPEQAGPDG